MKVEVFYLYNINRALMPAGTIVQRECSHLDAFLEIGKNFHTLVSQNQGICHLKGPPTTVSIIHQFHLPLSIHNVASNQLQSLALLLTA